MTLGILRRPSWLRFHGHSAGVGGSPGPSFATAAPAHSAWVDRTPWIENLASNPAVRSNTSVCLKIVDPRVTSLDAPARQAFVKRMKGLLESEGAAFDVESHRNAPAGLRIWCGCTVETDDVAAGAPWLDWAFQTAVAEL